MLPSNVAVVNVQVLTDWNFGHQEQLLFNLRSR